MREFPEDHPLARAKELGENLEPTEFQPEINLHDPDKVIISADLVGYHEPGDQVEVVIGGMGTMLYIKIVKDDEMKRVFEVPIPVPVIAKEVKFLFKNDQLEIALPRKIGGEGVSQEKEIIPGIEWETMLTDKQIAIQATLSDATAEDLRNIDIKISKDGSKLLLSVLKEGTNKVKYAGAFNIPVPVMTEEMEYGVNNNQVNIILPLRVDNKQE